jgi:hypothetical protein
MRGRRRGEIPDQASRCLACACENRENEAAAELLAKAEALSATGVVAAIFLAGSDQHHELTERARRAIAEQRDWCDVHGAFHPNCPLLDRRRG